MNSITKFYALQEVPFCAFFYIIIITVMNCFTYVHFVNASDGI